MSNLYKDAANEIERVWLEREFSTALKGAGLATTDCYRARAAGLTLRGLDEDPPMMLPRRAGLPLIPADSVVQAAFAESERRRKLRARLVAFATAAAFVAGLAAIAWVIAR